tara:strand:+ start:33 stop:275 length:243 start_codon:yes stop_codon:yes gene_type:complete
VLSADEGVAFPNCGLGQGASLRVGHLPHEDQDEVDKRPDTESTQSEQLEEPESCIAEVKPIDPKGAQEETEKYRCRELLV